MAHSRLGQHFLVSPIHLAKIAAPLKVSSRDTVIEIGPGHGELTRHLVRARRIILLERDPGLARALENEFADGHIDIHCGDALAALPSVTKDLGEYKITGNIPYYITGHLFRLLTELPHKPTRGVFVIQKEVAVRLAAEPPHMNRLAAFVQYWYQPRIVLSLPRKLFRPPPAVDSAAIVLDPIPPLAVPWNEYSRVAHILFQQPRKTITNNLRAGGIITSRETLELLLQKLDINPGARPQDLSREDIDRLAQALAAARNMP